MCCRTPRSTSPKPFTLSSNGPWQGIYRTIPVEYAGPGGFNYSLFLTDIRRHGFRWRTAAHRKAAARRKSPAENLRSRSRRNFRDISLHYRVRNGLRFFDDHDELYWNVTGNGWDVPIESASAHVILPEGVTGLRAANYTGFFGSRAQDSRVDILGSNVDIQTQRPLTLHEGLTIVAGWDKGLVHEPRGTEKVAQFLESNWPFFVPHGCVCG